MINEDQEDIIENDEQQIHYLRRNKKWKYKLNEFCLKHKQRFSFKCNTCNEKGCDACLNKYHGDHEISVFPSQQKEKHMNYALDYILKDIECMSNIVSYVSKEKKTYLVFSTYKRICEFDLEKREFTRQVDIPQLYSHLIYIRPNLLVAASFFGNIRIYSLDTMKILYSHQQTRLIKQIIYFDKYKVFAVINELDHMIYILNFKLKVIRYLISPVKQCFYNNIEKLNDLHLVSCSDIFAPIIKWNIATGEIVQLYKQKIGIQMIKILNLNRVITLSLSYSMTLRDSYFKKVHSISNKYCNVDCLILYNQQNIIFSNTLNSQITIFNIIKSKQLQNITLPQQVRNLAIVNNQIIASGKDIYIYQNKPVHIQKYLS